MTSSTIPREESALGLFRLRQQNLVRYEKYLHSDHREQKPWEAIYSATCDETLHKVRGTTNLSSSPRSCGRSLE